MKSTKIDLITPELAEICGIHAGDGYLRNDGHRKELDISGSCEEKEYYDYHVIPLFNKVFNLDIKGRFFPARNTYGFVIRDVAIIEFMHEVLEFPYGSKSLKVKVPDFIISNPSLMAPFLRGYFDTDGHIGCVKKYGQSYSKFKKMHHCYPRIIFSTVSPCLSEHLRVIFDSLGFKFCFHTYQPLKKTESLKYIYEINGINRVDNVVILVDPKNHTKISRYAVWKKFGFCPTNINYQQRMSILDGKLDPYIFYKGL